MVRCSMPRNRLFFMRRRCRGMTLLELTVSMTVLVAVVMIAGAGLIGSRREGEKTVDASIRGMEAEHILHTIATDLERTVPIQRDGQILFSLASPVSGARHLTFATIEIGSDGKVAGAKEISYRWRKTADAWVFERAEDNTPDGVVDFSAPEVRILGRGFSVTPYFAASVGGGDPVTDWSGRSVLPDDVTVRIQIVGRGSAADRVVLEKSVEIPSASLVKG